MGLEKLKLCGALDILESKKRILELYNIFFLKPGQPKTLIVPIFAGSVGNKSSATSLYLDLAYLPSGFAASTVDVEFFRHVRSSCYIISGEESYKDSVMRPILESLLEGKAAWPHIQVGYGLASV